MDTSKRSLQWKRFLGGCVGGVVGLLAFVSWGAWMGIAGSVCGFILGGFGPGWMRNMYAWCAQTRTITDEERRKRAYETACLTAFVVTVIVMIVSLSPLVVLGNYIDTHKATIEYAGVLGSILVFFFAGTGLVTVATYFVALILLVAPVKERGALYERDKFELISARTRFERFRNMTQARFASDLTWRVLRAWISILYSAWICTLGNFVVTSTSVVTKWVIAKLLMRSYLLSVIVTVATTLWYGWIMHVHAASPWLAFHAVGAGVCAGVLSLLLPEALSIVSRLARRTAWDARVQRFTSRLSSWEDIEHSFATTFDKHFGAWTPTWVARVFDTEESFLNI